MEPNTESTFSHPLPELPRVREEARKHVIVIGAGAVGLSSALWLLRAGHFVTVCDPAPPLPGINYSKSASFGNACAIALAAVIPVSMPGLAMDVPRMLLDREGPLSIYWQDFPCLTGWLVEFLKAGRPDRVREIVATLGGLLRAAHAGLAPLIEESGASHLVRNTGCLYLYPTEEGVRKSRYSMQLREEQGVRMRVLDADEIRDREPALAPRYRMGVDFQDAYSLDSPEQCMRLFARAIEARGGRYGRRRRRRMVRKAGAGVGRPHSAQHRAGIPCHVSVSGEFAPVADLLSRSWFLPHANGRWAALCRHSGARRPGQAGAHCAHGCH